MFFRATINCLQTDKILCQLIQVELSFVEIGCFNRINNVIHSFSVSRKIQCWKIKLFWSSVCKINETCIKWIRIFIESVFLSQKLDKQRKQCIVRPNSYAIISNKTLFCKLHWMRLNSKSLATLIHFWCLCICYGISSAKTAK